MSAPRRTTYPDRLQLRVPTIVRETLEREAQRARCGPGEYARQVLLAGLEAKGVQLPPAELAEA